ncbi:MAG: ABC transporter permease [Prevotellaceae bacterium]|jgi:putative ABC transport system permease protein|nr:ABC transporter permease [Prevotellaceae bacterium]
MIALYFKQAWMLLRQNRLVSGLSIAGTALSVAAIMLVILVYQVSYADYPPESNRFRTLYLDGMEAHTLSGRNYNGATGYRVLHEALYPLKTPQAVAALTNSGRNPINLPGEKLMRKFTIKYTDATFWRVLDFTFVQGAPFTQADFDAALHKAVISESTARRLFGTTEVVGRVFQRMQVDYTVCGVVREVSTAAVNAYADIWMPYTVRPELIHDFDRYENTTGGFGVLLLARSSSDFPAIRNELAQSLARFNASLAETTISYGEGPVTQWDKMMGGTCLDPANVGEFLSGRGFLLLFLLLLPALNIIGITLTQFRKRRSEIGVRKAFGARAGGLVKQIVTENMLYALIGGLFGLALAYVLLSCCKSFLISSTVELTGEMLIRPGTFLIALCVTLLMNLVSVGVPALRAGRMPIVRALNDEE